MKAFRGNERFTALSGVVIAETREQFGYAMQRVLSGDVPPLSQNEILDTITWTNTLQPIVDLIETVTVCHRSGLRAQTGLGRNGCAPQQAVPSERTKLIYEVPSGGPEGHLSNDELLALLHPWSGQVPRGYIPTFTGAMMAAHFWAHWLSDRRLVEVFSADQRFESTRRPTFGDGEYYFEQANIIRSVLSAKNTYVMVELGGGNGPRAVDAALVIRTLRPEIRPFLVVVEALPTYVDWCKHHFAANGLDADEHWIINGIVSACPAPELFFLQPRGFGNQMADASTLEVLSSLISDKAAPLTYCNDLAAAALR